MEEKLNQLTFINATLFGLLIGLAYYVFFYHSLSSHNQIEKAKQDILRIKKDILKLDEELKAEQRINQEVLLMEKKSDKVYSQLSENLSVEQVVNTISEEARSIGLSIESISAASGGWEEKKTIAVVSIDANLSGSFNKIMVFLSELTRNNRAYSVLSLLLSANSQRDKLGALSITTKFKAYRKLTEKEKAFKRGEGANE